jgi:cellulose synthase/poly-beta-1,6-N-acetylglucosamine synthase-like glycosyltransferase
MARDLEIPYESERKGHYRLFEILPGAITWVMLLLPFILSLINVTLAALFVLIYLLVYFCRAMAVNVRSLQGYHTMRQYQKLDWKLLFDELAAGKIAEEDLSKRPAWHQRQVARCAQRPAALDPNNMLHAVIIATYNENRETLEPTIQSVLDSNFDMQKVLLVLAYEERGGPEVEEQAEQLMKEYKTRFKYAVAIKHPKGIRGEFPGKGANVTFAARRLVEHLEKQHIDTKRVVVTTLDSDNRPDRQYLAGLSYVYGAYDDPHHVSVQPISMYTNNIWDAPAPMRVLATGNSFYNIVMSVRPHILRNFSSHAQTLAALIETDFWSVRTIVEDGHQFWRSYFCYEGHYRVLPLYIPIYQDAVLGKTYRKTLKAQFLQLRRWTWGVSDVAYVVDQGYFKKNKVPKIDLLMKSLRLLEGHVTWAVAPLLLLFSGFIPALFHPQSYAANELPLIVSRVQRVALVGGAASLFVCLKTLPPKPARYRQHRRLYMILQWVYLPVTTIVFNSFAALYSQTRLMFGWYIAKFDVTEKAVVDEAGNTKSTIGNT